MIEPASQRHLTSTASANGTVNSSEILSQHELLDEARCDAFSLWIREDLERFERRFQSFTTRRTLLSSIR